MKNCQNLKRYKHSTDSSHPLNLDSKVWQSLRRKGALLFLSGQGGFLLAQLTEDTATITWKEDEESILVAEPHCPGGSRRMGSEAECRRPWKKLLRKGMAKSLRGGSCMVLGSQEESWARRWQHQLAL